MVATSIRHFWPFRHYRPDQAVIHDADTLIRIHGEQAFETACLNSWREDIGLLSTDRPGHWHRVGLNIGQRLD